MKTAALSRLICTAMCCTALIFSSRLNAAATKENERFNNEAEIHLKAYVIEPVFGYEFLKTKADALIALLKDSALKEPVSVWSWQFKGMTEYGEYVPRGISGLRLVLKIKPGERYPYFGYYSSSSSMFPGKEVIGDYELLWKNHLKDRDVRIDEAPVSVASGKFLQYIKAKGDSAEHYLFDAFRQFDNVKIQVKYPNGEIKLMSPRELYYEFGFNESMRFVTFLNMFWNPHFGQLDRDKAQGRALNYK